ncbi:hypothetical protein [Saccharomonospora iraqiensis]|uniref:hypothetical protein n=1 Tax=Saccharomonospora iraqiensis TaxID=52698 RepID=UPI00022E3216|nr:hypothetical protein [Saccharomonospora iraqiensis]
MRRNRAAASTLTMMLAALFAVLLTGTATAAEATSPARTTDTTDVADVTAADYELDYAVAGTPPSRSELRCGSVTAVEICYQAYGDRWWIRDLRADGASAAVDWDNFRNGDLYREGMCVTSLGAGEWGQCNKNYYEDSVVNGYPCVWDRSESDYANCSTSGWRFQ